MPDERLRAAAAFVRQGAVFADIGTDHAYLPVFLCREKRLKHAYACDIVEGPLKSAVAHIRESGLEELITPVLTDGLNGLEGYGITDVAVCGMGGELIADIISRASFVKESGVRLILQPMTRARDLRAFLAKEGFAVLDECVCCAKGKYYFCLSCEFTGEPYALSRMEEELGRVNLCRRPVTEEFRALVLQKLRAAEKRLAGFLKGGLDTAEEEMFVESLRALLQKMQEE